MSEFEDFRDRVFTLYSDRQYEELHVLLDGAVERFPNRRSRITYWQACVDSLRGEPERALERLRRGVDEGMFWRYHCVMRYPTGRGEQIPSAIFRGVTEHARRMGYPVASDDLFLLAVAELAEGTTAREVLESVGINAERLATEISSLARPMPAESNGLLFPPAFNSMAGRAEAFAASLGDGPISPEHVLIALIWDPSSQASQLLWRLGVRREDIIDRLRSRGGTVPRASIAPQVEVERGDRIWIDRDDVQHLIAELPKRLPPDARFGFNYEDDRAWVVAEASIDLRSLVDSILTS